jgi:hypothetical protein
VNEGCDSRLSLGGCPGISRNLDYGPRMPSARTDLPYCGGLPTVIGRCRTTLHTDLVDSLPEPHV